mmetsp:Transcript_28443/g.42554  ORF Transcript_28443/g.42554 Transcript_28443/m.42554 type:complete len:125 (+) Transcript_28443:114-488(+)
MITIAEGVEFDTIAREWRCKWSPDAEKASLVSAQKALESVLATVKDVDGVKKVDRVVCGGCLDFKVRWMTTMCVFSSVKRSSVVGLYTCFSLSQYALFVTLQYYRQHTHLQKHDFFLDCYISSS